MLAFAALAYASGGGSGEHHADWGGFLIRSMNFVVLVAVLVIVFILVGQFNSFRKPLIILLTIPLGLIGGSRRRVHAEAG